MKRVTWLLVFMVGCAHYQPAHLGSGEFTNRQVKGCSWFVLGMPTSPEKERLDLVLSDSMLEPSDVFSVENCKKLCSLVFGLRELHDGQPERVRGG